ncbi:DapH/DapD/GlmU-related protein [Clostridium perfringens]|uniref:acyltransferase n=1 Tax=Clostridium perfringens TaxID=1502 RepID=UPI001A9ACB01|nr:acyltransferase [Clostridium perfringens]EJT6501161.1 acyltransferase [Clostridium perfringens]MDK3223011.1 acyltransferase [Clostridium perfringens]MDM0833120.1 acyltransferase [Clostridium perfringens]
MRYKLRKFLYKLLKKDTMNLDIENFRKKGAKIGENVRAFSPIMSAEPYLLEVGNSVTISTDVKFITHDNSISKIIKDKTDIFGQIIIGDNCFIGASSILLPGVKLGNNTVVGAGSVVTKSFSEGNVVIAGNPAKVICSVEKYSQKIEEIAMNTLGMSFNDKRKYILKNKKNFYSR